MGVSAVIAIAAAVVGAASAIQSSEAQAEQQRANANAAQYNSQVDKISANNAVNTANSNALTKTRAASYEMSQQRAALGQSGTGFTGSNLDVIGASAQNASLDASKIRYGGDQQAWALNNNVTLDNMQADQDNINAHNAITAGYYGAASSVIGASAGYYGRAKPTGARATS